MHLALAGTGFDFCCHSCYQAEVALHAQTERERICLPEAQCYLCLPLFWHGVRPVTSLLGTVIHLCYVLIPAAVLCEQQS